MTDGVLVITVSKFGSQWDLRLNIPGRRSGLKCPAGWKTRKGRKGPGRTLIEGALPKETESVIDAIQKCTQSICSTRIFGPKDATLYFDVLGYDRNKLGQEIAVAIKGYCDVEILKVIIRDEVPSSTASARAVLQEKTYNGR
jgi:hypothetical protein